MARQQGFSIFNKEAQEKLRSPDDLDKYVRVTTPGKWSVIVAFAILLLGILTWATFGTVSTSVAATGVVVDGKALCFLPADEVVRVHVGDSAFMGGEKLKVSKIDKVPSSREEANKVLGSDYLVETLFEGKWATEVTFEGNVSSLDEGVPIEVNVTTERIAPITVIMGK